METFWIVSLGNGRASGSLSTWTDVCTWLEDEASQFLKKDSKGVVKDPPELDFQKVNIRRHKRKALPERLKELESDEKDLQARIERLRAHKEELLRSA